VSEPEHVCPSPARNRRNPGRVPVSYRAVLRGWAFRPISQGAAIGLTAALAWTIEAVALQAATVGTLVTAAQLAGYVRTIHPAAASRAGSRKAVAEQLEERLQTGLPPAELARAVGEGGRWSAWSAAEVALLVLE